MTRQPPSDLSWREALSQDRPALQQFTCTEPKPTGSAYRQPHRYPHALDVQSYIRDRKPPCGPQTLQLGWSPEQEIAAVASWTARAPGVFDLHVVAVAEAFRGCMPKTGDAVLDHVLSVMTYEALASDASTLSVVAYIDVRNWPSQRLFERHGFECASCEGEKAQAWLLDRSLVGLPIEDTLI